jgi:hypothetical protein
MPGIDTSYIPLNYLQQYFVDKLDGSPLAGGLVTFYKDQARTQLKSVYKISGTPPNYVYTALPNNPLVLSSTGTFIDPVSGDDITVYLNPYDSAGNIELYYITIHSALGVLQETREGVPNLGSASQNESIEATNYIPNGQFLIHRDLKDSGKIVTDFTDVAYGGWFFERPSGSSSTDLVSFTRFGAPLTNPTENPRYAIAPVCQIPNVGDTFKYIGVRFKDVNKFSSATQQYTLFFSARSNSGASVSVDIKYRKYFGAGGSATVTSASLGNFIVGTSYQNYSTAFVFGDNIGKTIGANDDDYVDVLISLPANYVFDASFTDIVLLKGDVVIASFPITTTSQTVYRSLAGFMPIPNPDGSDIGLPIMLSTSGWAFDRSQIGKVYDATDATLKLGELECDGAQYVYENVSSDNIPYKRLGDILWVSSAGRYRYGSGYTYVTGSPQTTTEFNIYVNAPGVNTAASDGAVATGFTFSSISAGHADIYDFNGFQYNASADILIYGDTLAPALSPSAVGTSGFTIVTNDDGDTNSPQSVTITALAAAGLAGLYFLISNTTTDFYVWFTVDAVGVDPAVVGRTGIQIDLLSTDTDQEVAAQILANLLGNTVTRITTVAASAFSGGAYFHFYSNTNANHYVVWYEKDGVGTQPVVAGATAYVKVVVAATHTAQDVNTRTYEAINRKYFCVPDCRGFFPRYWDHAAGRDPDAASRTDSAGGNGQGLTGDNVGTMQSFAIEGHLHSFPTYTFVNTSVQSDNDRPIYPSGATANTNPTGGAETRPKNIYVHPVIKY